MSPEEFDGTHRAGAADARRRPQECARPGQEDRLVDRDGAGARHANERDGPLPSGVAGHEAAKQVGEQPVAVYLDPDVLTNEGRRARNVLGHQPGEIDRVGKDRIGGRAAGPGRGADSCRPEGLVLEVRRDGAQHRGNLAGLARRGVPAAAQ